MRLKIFILLLVTACSLVGCSGKGNKPATKRIVKSAIRYYVKYEYDVIFNLNFDSVPQKVACMTDKGEVRMDIEDNKWSAVYGPFKKGDKVFLKVTLPNSFKYKQSINRLSVSINNEPFCLKKEVRSSTAQVLKTEYIIGQ